MSEQRSSLSRIPQVSSGAASPAQCASPLPRPPSASQFARQVVETGSAGGADAARDAVQRRLSGSSTPNVGSPSPSANGRGQPASGTSALRRSYIPSPSGSLQTRRSLTASRGSGILDALAAADSPSQSVSVQRSLTPPGLPSNSTASILDSPNLMSLSSSQQHLPTLSRQTSYAQSTAHHLHEDHDIDYPSASHGNRAPQATNIVVSVRLRPMSDKERTRGDHEAWSVDNHNNVGLWKGGKWEPKFHFDHVFGPQARNRDLFESLVRPLIAPALQGYSGTVFAYGVTSSGKTHTMMGNAPIEDRRGSGATSPSPSGEVGLVPLTVYELFRLIDAANSTAAEAAPGTPVTTYTVRLAMMEIYNEVLNDLLDPSMTNLKLREDPNKGVVVENLYEAVVQSAEQALACMAKGDMYRKVSCTAYNEDSSRSHTICRLTIEGTQRAAGTSLPASPGTQGGSGKGKGTGAAGRVTTAVLSLIDLAGSESAKVSVSKGQRMEGSFINKSLLTLGPSSGAGATNASSQHIPFRDSKLTRLLQNSMTGTGARIAVVCNITPAAAQMEETANTLKFASRAKLIRLTVAAQETVDTRTLLRQYRHELKLLRAQLAALTHPSHTHAHSLTLPDTATGLVPLPAMSPPHTVQHTQTHTSAHNLDATTHDLAGLISSPHPHASLHLDHDNNNNSIPVHSTDNTLETDKASRGLDGGLHTEGVGEGVGVSGQYVDMLKRELASALSMLKVERDARVHAEKQVEQLERRLHGMTRLLESRSHGGAGTRGATGRGTRTSEKGELPRSGKSPPASLYHANRRPSGTHTYNNTHNTTQDPPRPHTPAAIPSSPARGGAARPASAARSGGAGAADRLVVSLPDSARGSENGVLSPRAPESSSGGSLGRSSGTLSLVGESSGPRGGRVSNAGTTCSSTSNNGSCGSPRSGGGARRGVGPSVSAGVLTSAGGAGAAAQAVHSRTPSSCGGHSVRRGQVAWSDSGRLATPPGDQSPTSLYAPTESSLYDTESDAALIEQIQGLQEELLSGGMASVPHTGLPPGPLPTGHSPTSGGGVSSGSGIPTTYLPTLHSASGASMGSRGPHHHHHHQPSVSSNGGVGVGVGYGAGVARSEVTHTAGCSRTASVMGDADEDLEIQVLLADREVLQDQVLAVELDNERLVTANEVLSAEADRLRLEHEKAIRVNKELESDMAAMRDFKNQMAAELEFLRQQVQSALEQHTSTGNMVSSITSAHTSGFSTAAALGLSAGTGAGMSMNTSGVLANSGGDTAGGQQTARPPTSGIPMAPTIPGPPATAEAKTNGADPAVVAQRLQSLEAQAQSVLLKMLQKN